MGTDYQRVARAIAYLGTHAAQQPSLEEIAAQVNLSPYHFQRMFCRWAGTTPKRFLQVLTLERGKDLLQQSRSQLDTSHAVGLSGGSRLYDHFVQLEAVTPGEHKRRGDGVELEYGVHPTPFGPMFLACTGRGICRAGFVDYTPAAAQLAQLREDWPLARLTPNARSTGDLLEAMFSVRRAPADRPLSLQVVGTNFQVAVWRALLAIPPGKVASYGELAGQLGRPGAGRAVGNAVGANPVAFLIPCHRVIRESGALGGYRWGAERKQLIQLWERMRAEH